MLVCYRGILPSIRQLLDRGASRLKRDRKGSTALHYAVDGEKLEAISLLLNFCPESDAVDRESKSDKALVDEQGEEPMRSELLSARDASGCCAIVRCAMLKNNGNPDVTKALLDAGASADAVDDQVRPDGTVLLRNAPPLAHGGAASQRRCRPDEAQHQRRHADGRGRRAGERRDAISAGKNGRCCRCFQLMSSTSDEFEKV
uniref:ANK_REP_REGION domain-containing protein n=1 Tax=Macrostomum lignano TaxID=282301 RepID=A0A1I8IRC9_9PLAT